MSDEETQTGSRFLSSLFLIFARAKHASPSQSEVEAYGNFLERNQQKAVTHELEARAVDEIIQNPNALEITSGMARGRKVTGCNQTQVASNSTSTFSPRLIVLRRVARTPCIPSTRV
jgi:hypothetical protein